MPGLISIDRQLCLNDNYNKMACRRCRDICPAGCLGEDRDIGPGCNECGLCLSVCPVDAVAGENFPSAPLAGILDDPRQPVVLGCHRRRQDSPWPCLGFLDGRLLLALVASGEGAGRKVAVDDAACAACRPAVAAHLDETIVEVNRLLLLAGKHTVSRGDEAAGMKQPEKPISRRAFFSAMLGATLDTVREVVAAGAGGGERLPRHTWFTRYVVSGDFASETPSPIFAGLSITEACQACGLCIRICKNGALTAMDHGVALEFYHHPGRCSGCGLCVAHCPQAALTVESAGRPDTYMVARRELPRCQDCGQVFQPVGNNKVCIECLLNKANRTLLPVEENQEESS